MHILFALLTFLLFISLSYLWGQKQEAQHVAKHMRVPLPAPKPEVLFDSGIEIPKDFAFHPGHTWVVDEGRNNARIGVDRFGATLLGKVDRVEIAPLNSWVRQGQKLMTVRRDNMAVDLVSPMEGVVAAINPRIQQDPSLIATDPYNEGWVAVVKAPDLKTNLRNLVAGPFVGPWMKNSISQMTNMVAQHAPTALAQDGGLPAPGVLAQLEPELQQRMIHEFFLT